MILNLFKSPATPSIPQQLYGALMAQSRDPAFYRKCDVPDTVMGRFDMLAMHTYLFNRRLKVEPSENAAELSQEVFDLFVADIERALRQIGIGDTTVPKRKKKLVHSYYAQIEEFDPVLDKKSKDDVAKLVSDRYLKGIEGVDGAKVADYMLRACSQLEDTPWSQIATGNLAWPTVENNE